MGRTHDHKDKTLITFAPPTFDRLADVAANLSADDIAEIAAYGVDDTVTGLEHSVREAYWSMILCRNGVPQAVFGIAVTPEGVGVPWMFATQRVWEWRKDFHKTAIRQIAMWSRMHPRLENFVADCNARSIRWLGTLGFVIDEPLPLGPNGELFRKFWMDT